MSTGIETKPKFVSPSAPLEAIVDTSIIAIPLGDVIRAETPIAVYDNRTPTNGRIRIITIPVTSPAATKHTQQPTTYRYSEYEPKTSALATTSFVLGVVGLFSFFFGIITGILAIIFGVMAINVIRSKPDEYQGSCMACFGIITGSTCIVFWIYVLVLIFQSAPEN